jgi:hypothetical protein
LHVLTGLTVRYFREAAGSLITVYVKKAPKAGGATETVLHTYGIADFSTVGSWANMVKTGLTDDIDVKNFYYWIDRHFDSTSGVMAVNTVTIDVEHTALF